jgi:hypothetical protein
MTNLDPKSIAEKVFSRQENPYKIRLEMQRKGWISRDEIEITWGSKHYGYSIWFERWDWHGVPCDKRTFQAHTGNLDKISETVKRAADLAQKAWDEFSDNYQSGNDSVKSTSCDKCKGTGVFMTERMMRKKEAGSTIQPMKCSACEGTGKAVNVQTNQT